MCAGCARRPVCAGARAVAPVCKRTRELVGRLPKGDRRILFEPKSESCEQLVRCELRIVVLTSEMSSEQACLAEVRPRVRRLPSSGRSSRGLLRSRNLARERLHAGSLREARVRAENLVELREGSARVRRATAEAAQLFRIQTSEFGKLRARARQSAEGRRQGRASQRRESSDLRKASARIEGGSSRRPATPPKATARADVHQERVWVSVVRFALTA